MKNSIQSKVFTFAHQIKTNFQTWSQALKFAWKKLKIQAKLKSGKVNFTFLKKSGEIRKAFGTTQYDSFDYDFKGGASKCWYIVKYYDLEKYDWRCFDVRNLIEVVNVQIAYNFYKEELKIIRKYFPQTK